MKNTKPKEDNLGALIKRSVSPGTYALLTKIWEEKEAEKKLKSSDPLPEKPIKFFKGSEPKAASPEPVVSRYSIGQLRCAMAGLVVIAKETARELTGIREENNLQDDDGDEGDQAEFCEDITRQIKQLEAATDLVQELLLQRNLTVSLKRVLKERKVLSNRERLLEDDDSSEE